MSERITNYVIDKIRNFIENDIELLRNGPFSFLPSSEIEIINACLRVADSLEQCDEEVKVRVKQLREAAYDAEDVHEELRLLVARDHGEGLFGLVQKAIHHIKTMYTRKRKICEMMHIRSDIKRICKRTWKLSDKLKTAELKSNSYCQEAAWDDHRDDGLLMEKTDLVGIEEPKKQLVGCLVEGDSKWGIISVVGMAGLGKTTLLKQVYDDPIVKRHFALCAWITLPPSSKTRDVLEDILRQIVKAVRKPVPLWPDNERSIGLKFLIKEYLQKTRYLIVLDDVWEVSRWGEIKYALPKDENGSRVVLTTRNAEVAQAALGQVYEMQPLSEEQSWKLFCQRTFRGESCPSNLMGICKYILKKCEGNPLPIVAISGALATKDKNRVDEWELVRRSIRSELKANGRLRNVKTVLSLSFQVLPYCLKNCFLHLCVFPEDHLIEPKRLVRLWTAEGLLEVREGKTPEEVAWEYLGELFNRSLLQVGETTLGGRVKLCRIHDFFREIIISKSADRNFAVIADQQTTAWPMKVRRLSVSGKLHNMQKNRLASLRSLYMFKVGNKTRKSVLDCDSKVIRVVDFHGTPLKKFPLQIVRMSSLRYLSLRFTKLRRIPGSVGMLQDLETLDLKYTKVTELPKEIEKLKNLRHLLVYRYELMAYAHSKYGFKTSANIGELRSLQKLCYIETHGDNDSISIAELGKLSQLRRLCILKLKKEDGSRLCSSVMRMRDLRALNITSLEDDEEIDLDHLSSPPPFLSRIYLRGRLEKLPKWISNLQNLVKLHLRSCLLGEDPIESLQSLPNLEHLELLQVYEWKVLFIREKGFMKLKILALDLFDKLQVIEVEKGAMPCLEKLIIQRCKMLDNIPSGIEHLTELKVLEFSDMPTALVRKLWKDESNEENQTLAHIPELRYGYWTDEGWVIKSVLRSSKEDCSSYRECVNSRSQLPPCWK